MLKIFLNICHIAALSVAAFSNSGCVNKIPQSGELLPAVLSDTNEDTLEKVRQSLAKHKGHDMVKLGGVNTTQPDTISIVPLPLSPHDTMSFEKPELFKVFFDGKTCFLKSTTTEKLVSLEKVECKAL